jgi:hypothetical protein
MLKFRIFMRVWRRCGAGVAPKGVCGALIDMMAAS